MLNWPRIIPFIGILLFPFLLEASVCESHKSCSDKFVVKDNFLTYFSTHKINLENTNIERLVIVIHGALRNGHEYFDDTVVAAKKLNVENKTIVLAPTFRKVTDERAEGEMYWGRKWYTKWKYGYLSEDSDKVSSFDVLDKLITKITTSNNFPNLKSIVVTGHSAGGQFTQRYGVSTRIGKSLSQTFTIVPSNPSSYMYLDAERYEFTNGNYQIKNLKNDCSEYNNYIYGPINRARYMENMSIAELRYNFKNQKMIYLMSEQDKGTDSLDRSCEAKLQGKNRFERSQNFFHYVKKQITSTNHRFLSIPEIGHDHVLVYESREAAEVIFGLPVKKDPSFHYKKIGSVTDVTKPINKMFVMFGGGKNEISGMRRFLKAANGGDLLVVSGKDVLNQRYTHDFWNMAELEKIALNSVQTISFINKEAGEKEFVLNKIKNAEAIFFTGGNQAKYINRVKGTSAHKEILSKVTDGIAVGGTSAGLAIMGEYIFSAQSGGLSSSYVLRNPHTRYISIEHDFFFSPLLGNLITDTHFNERGREGRLLGFMFKTQFEKKLSLVHGVGIDEQTSLTIFDNFEMISSGKGHVTFYKSLSGNVSQQMRRLNYENIFKLELQHETTYRHYSKLDFSNATLLNVVNGEVKY